MTVVTAHRLWCVHCAGRGMVCQMPTLGMPVMNPKWSGVSGEQCGWSQRLAAYCGWDTDAGIPRQVRGLLAPMLMGLCPFGSEWLHQYGPYYNAPTKRQAFSWPWITQHHELQVVPVSVPNCQKQSVSRIIQEKTHDQNTILHMI